MCLILKYAQLTRLRVLMHFEINIINYNIKYKLSETHTHTHTHTHIYIYIMKINK
jgi:hypothetical protein